MFLNGGYNGGDDNSGRGHGGSGRSRPGGWGDGGDDDGGDDDDHGWRFPLTWPFVAPAACYVQAKALTGMHQQQSFASVALAGSLGFHFEDGNASRPRLGSSLADPAAFVGDTQRPVVILLSWLGARNRQMTKYADWYRERGYDVIMVLNGLHTALIPRYSRRQAMRIMHTIDEIPDNRPIVVHSFSIGTGIYGFMLDLMNRGQNVTEEMVGKIHRQVRGVIFDSGPGHMHASAVARGLHAACPNVGLKIWNALAEGMFRVLRVSEGFRSAEHALQHVQLPSVPQLYLYSLDDTVVKDLDESIRQYIDAQKKRGLEVYHKVWECSQHATHFKIHPDEYKESVDRFLKRAMTDVEGGVKGVIEAVHDLAANTAENGGAALGLRK